MKIKGNKRNEENKTRTQLLISMHCTYLFRFASVLLASHFHSISSERTRNEMGMEPRHVVCLSERLVVVLLSLTRARALSLSHTHTCTHTATHTAARTGAVRLAGRSYASL